MSHLPRWQLALTLLVVSCGAAANPAAMAQYATSNVRQSASAGDNHAPPRLPLRFDETEQAGPGAAARAPVAGPPGEVSQVALPDARGEEPLPLPPRTERQSLDPGTTNRPSSQRALTTALGSLGLVLVVFFTFVWAARRHTPKGQAPLPAEVVESLGRAPLGRQQMHLVRLGKKLILLSVAAGETRTLTEITDPVEVDRLAGLCEQSRPGSITATFRQVLSEASPGPRERSGRPQSTRAARGGRHG